MGEFILKYWVEVVLGLVVTGLGIICRKFWKMYSNEKDSKRNVEHQEMRNDFKTALAELYEKSQEDDDKLQLQINELIGTNKIIQRGLLSVQGSQFKHDCRKLLEPDHTITLDEFEQLDKDHEAYNELGGNHAGDQLFALAKKKYESQITK